MHFNLWTQDQQKHLMMINNIHCNFLGQWDPTKGGMTLKNSSITEAEMLRCCSPAGYEMIWTETYSFLIKKWKICICNTYKRTQMLQLFSCSFFFLYTTRTSSELVHFHITNMVLFWFSDIFNNIMHCAWRALFHSYIITRYKSISYVSCRINKFLLYMHHITWQFEL